MIYSFSNPLSDKNKHRKSSDYIISRNIAWLLLIIITYNTVNSTLGSSLNIAIGFSYILKFLTIFLFLSSLLHITKKKELNRLIILEGVFLFLYLLTYLRGTATNDVIIECAVNTMIIALPIMIFIYSIKNKYIFIEMMLRYAYVSVIIVSFYLINLTKNQSYIDSLSTYVCVFALFIWNDVLNLKRHMSISVPFAIYITMFLVFFGNRRAILVIALFVFICIIKKAKGSWRAKTFSLLSIIASLVLINKLEILILYFNNLFQEVGIKSYTLLRINTNSFFTDSARGEIYRYYLELVNQKPILGWGIVGGIREVGYHTHNGLLELLLAYGYVFGGLLCILLAYITVKSLVISDTNSSNGMLLLMFSCQVINYFISSGLMQQSFIFFIFIMLYFTNGRTKYQNITEEKYEFFTRNPKRFT